MNIYLGLLFLNGHVVHPDDVVEPASDPGSGIALAAPIQQTPFVQARIADLVSVSGGCA